MASLYVHEAYAEIASRSPGSVAVEDPSTGESVTYRGVITMGGALCDALSGLLPGGEIAGSIAMMSLRSVQTLSVYVGTSMLGTSLLPLSPWAEAAATGMKRDDWMRSSLYALREGEAKILIVDDLEPVEANQLEFQRTAFQDLAVKICTVSDLISNPQPSTTDRNGTPVGGRSRIMLQLLSGGSTGNPKLHKIPHSVILSELKNYEYVLSSSSPLWRPKPSSPYRVLQQSPTVWPASAFGQINIALAVKGTVVIARDSTPSNLAKLLTSINIFGGTPSQLQLIGEFLTPSSTPLITALTWGEPLARSTGERIKSALPPKCALIELLVATEYWLSLFCNDLSGKFTSVPDCTVSIVEPDESGIGQLSLAGPMVATASETEPVMVTNDLISKHEDGSVEFIGRKDFMTKIGGAWFDVRQVESRVTEEGQWISPRVVESLFLTVRELHYLIVSVEVEDLPCDASEWTRQVLALVKPVCPVPVIVRTITGRFPRKSATGKLDRAAVVGDLEKELRSGIEPALVEVGRKRFNAELKSQLKWTLVFATLLGRWSVAAPYMYLVTLYLPRSAYLPKARVRSTLADWLNSLVNTMRKDLPFGVPGCILATILLRHKSKHIARFLKLWILLGVFLAARGKRLVSWPFAFWAAAGPSIRDDASYWLRRRKWRYLLDNILFTAMSVPDAVIGTNLCAKWDETVRQRKPTPTIQAIPLNEGDPFSDDEEEGEEGTPSEVSETDVPVAEEAVVIVTPADAALIEQKRKVDEWWNKSVVEYISLGRDERRLRSPAGSPNSVPPPLVACGSSVKESVLEIFAQFGLTDMESSLRHMSSLQVTVLVQRLRSVVADISVKLVLQSESVQQLLDAILTTANRAAYSQTTSSKTEGRSGTGICRWISRVILGAEGSTMKDARIQYSPGQINRPCRWMIQSKEPVDRARLELALNKLVERHPLLRSSLVDPKPLHSFLYDGGVTVANAKRFLDGRIVRAVIHGAAAAIHAAWVRLRVYPPTAQPAYWVDILTDSSVSDFDRLRRSVMDARRQLEDVWYTWQRPINVHLYSVASGEQFILISIKHSLSDGNSAFPLMDELAALYQGSALPDATDPVPELERRFADGIFSNESNPLRTSLRTMMFYSRTAERWGGGYYRHYVCFEKSAIRALRETVCPQLCVGFDSVLLSILVLSLMRTDSTNSETLTLYCPLRDGVNESSYIGLFTDWRDVTFRALPGGTVLDGVHMVAKKIRTRDWEPTLSPIGPESVLLNWLAFDNAPRLDSKAWHPYYLDKLTMSWNKMESRDFDLHSTPSGRLRSMSLEQYGSDGDWWLRFDVGMRAYPAEWMMKFSGMVNRTFHDVLNNPLVPMGPTAGGMESS